jgi:hypothetical protein
MNSLETPPGREHDRRRGRGSHSCRAAGPARTGCVSGSPHSRRRSGPASSRHRRTTPGTPRSCCPVRCPPTLRTCSPPRGWRCSRRICGSSPWTAAAPTGRCRVSTLWRCSTCSPSPSTPTRSRSSPCAAAHARTRGAAGQPADPPRQRSLGGRPARAGRGRRAAGRLPRPILPCHAAARQPTGRGDTARRAARQAARHRRHRARARPGRTAPTGLPRTDPAAVAVAGPTMRSKRTQRRSGRGRHRFRSALPEELAELCLTVGGPVAATAGDRR